MTLTDVVVALWPLVGSLLAIAFMQYLSRRTRAEHDREREAERLAAEQKNPHATR